MFLGRVIGEVWSTRKVEDLAGKRLLVIEVRAHRFAADCLKVARCIAAQEIDRIILLKRIPMDKRHGAKVDYPALRRQLSGRSTILAMIITIVGIFGRLQVRLRSTHG